MRGSTERILTTHVGSLPRPDDLVALNAAAVGALTHGETIDDRQRTDRLRSAVVEVVQKQRELGIDIVNDGEFGKTTVGRVDYGAWQSYAYEHLTGWEPGDMSNAPRPTEVDLGRAVPGGVPDRKERHMAEFEDFYQELARSFPTSLRMAFTGPISYRGQALIERDIAGLREAVRVTDAPEAFMTAVAPGQLCTRHESVLPTHEEFIFAVAAAMRVEYLAIIDAGFMLQIDDPGFAESWDAMDPAVTLDDYRAYIATSVEALNHALEGIPEDRIRYHLCWGSWHGPHVTDLPLREVADQLLRVRAGGYSLEAANPRHEHEWKVWRDVVKLPPGKL